MNNKEVQDNRRSYPIRIDREGVWYYFESEMIRKDIVKLFYENLHRNDAGEYFIEMGHETCFVAVEDTPYVIRTVYKTDAHNGFGERIKLVLNDLSVEELDPDSLRIGSDNVPYCKVRQGCFDARFSRAAYYQIAEYIEHDKYQNSFYLKLNNTRFYLTKPEVFYVKR